MINCYIDLTKTDYSIATNYKILDNPDPEPLLKIYDQYCAYNNFESVWPVFPEQFSSPVHDTIGYYVDEQLVAFSLIYKINNEWLEDQQFAWDYKEPKLALGIKSLETECALYKKLGYKYIILGVTSEYKTSFDGYTEFGQKNKAVKDCPIL
ncbi:MAG: hypothetical protein CMF52_08710 [Legionellales bacterium]|nr:hypothetical protein [Legionellales bacterium]|tara:strand:+ start:1840 stop:2295 length:456 start_codon:yes stop_codon:yes gene_type:complete